MLGVSNLQGLAFHDHLDGGWVVTSRKTFCPHAYCHTQVVGDTCCDADPGRSYSSRWIRVIASYTFVYLLVTPSTAREWHGMSSQRTLSDSASEREIFRVAPHFTVRSHIIVDTNFSPQSAASTTGSYMQRKVCCAVHRYTATPAPRSPSGSEQIAYMTLQTTSSQVLCVVWLQMCPLPWDFSTGDKEIPSHCMYTAITILIHTHTTQRQSRISAK